MSKKYQLRLITYYLMLFFHICVLKLISEGFLVILGTLVIAGLVVRLFYGSGIITIWIKIHFKDRRLNMIQLNMKKAVGFRFQLKSSFNLIFCDFIIRGVIVFVHVHNVNQDNKWLENFWVDKIQKVKWMVIKIFWLILFPPSCLEKQLFFAFGWFFDE